MTERSQAITQAELKALFDQAVRALSFAELHRKEALMAMETLRRALKASGSKTPTP